MRGGTLSPVETKTVVVVPLGALVNRIGTNRVAAVCQVASGGDYRLVWLTGTKNGGPTVFFASLNADKWQRATAQFDFDRMGLSIPTDPRSIAEGVKPLYEDRDQEVVSAND